MEYLKIGSNAMERQSINIITQILDPQTCSNEACVFLIQPTGILDKHTRIVIPMSRPTPGFDFPLSAGAMSVIQTATLRDATGNTIAQTDDIAQLHSKFNLHRPCEIREKVQSVKSANSMCFEISPGVDEYGEAGKYHLKGENFPWHFDSVYDYNTWGGYKLDGGTGGVGTTMITGVINPRFRPGLTAEPDTEFELNVSLEDLFPELFSNLLLPLHVLNGALSLQLLFTPEAARSVTDRCDILSPQTGGQNMAISTGKVRMVMDLLYYNDETMNLIKASTMGGNGLPLVYGDFLSIKSTITPPALAAQAYPSNGADRNGATFAEYNLGLDNMIIRYITSNLSLGLQSKVDATNLSQPTSICSPANLLNEFHSIAPRLTNGLSLNLIVNNNPLFPSDVEFYPRQYEETKTIHGFPQYTPQCTYSYQGSLYDRYAVRQFQAPAIGGFNVPNVSSIGIVNQNHAFARNNTTNQGIVRMDMGTLNNSAGAGPGGVTSNRPWGWMKGHSQGGLLGSLRNVGFNLRHTRANVSGAGTTIGNAPVSLRVRYTFSNESNMPFTTGATEPFNDKNITIISHICAERRMIIQNGSISVSEN